MMQKLQVSSVEFQLFRGNSPVAKRAGTTLDFTDVFMVTDFRCVFSVLFFVRLLD